jgi:holo-[acyl-carrier protein] synthase
MLGRVGSLCNGERAGGEAVIRGLGTDIVEIVRIGEMIERHGELFLQRVYTEQEVAYCQKRAASYQHFAGRWAAKEAVLKALGTGWAKGIAWRDIEVATLPSGQPRVLVHGAVKEISQQAGIAGFLVSISHCRSHATATAVAVGVTDQSGPAAEPHDA